MKDTNKGTVASNFRPITCLPLMWKLLTGMIADSLYNYLEDGSLLPHEQKGCRKRSRGAKDQLLIDRMVIRNCKRRLTGLGMAWIDYKKAFDFLPHTWILECLDMFGAAKNIQNLIANSMEHWSTRLTAGGVSLGNVKIQRGIFQGDSLSPLLFVIALIPLTLILRKGKEGYDLGKGKSRVSHLLFMDDLKLFGKNEKQLNNLVNTVRVFSKDIRMEFGVEKCAVLIMKRGKFIRSEGICLPDGQRIKSLEKEEGYKYLSILEADGVNHEQMKEMIRKEYLRRVRNILKAKLNGGNTIQAINSRAVSVIRYAAGIVKWTIDELRTIDTKTRKLLTIYRALHPRADVDRLYFKRREGGRGLISVQNCVEVESGSLFAYASSSRENLLKAVIDEGILKRADEKITMKYVQQERKASYHQKPMHGQFAKIVAEQGSKETWAWLRQGTLKKETEGTIMAAQDQALPTNAMKANIQGQNISPLCRMCGKENETVSHIVSSCEKLTQKYYKQWRHDKVAQILHWNLCKKYDLQAATKFYDHVPET